jgi:hypothetical protein
MCAGWLQLRPPRESLLPHEGDTARHSQTESVGVSGTRARVGSGRIYPPGSLRRVESHGRTVALLIVVGLALAGCGGSSGDQTQPASKSRAANTPATNPNPESPKDCLVGGERRSSRLWRGKWLGELVRIHRFDTPAEAKRAARAADLVAATSVKGFAVVAPQGGGSIVRQVGHCLERVPYKAMERKPKPTTQAAQAQPQTQPSASHRCPPGQLPQGLHGESGCGPSPGAPSVDSPEGRRELQANPDCQGLPPPPPSYHGPVQC